MSCCVWSWTHLLHSCRPSLQLRVWRELTSHFGIVVRGVECSAPHKEKKHVTCMSSSNSPRFVFSAPLKNTHDTVHMFFFSNWAFSVCFSHLYTRNWPFFGKQDSDHFWDFWIEKSVTPEKAFVWRILHPSQTGKSTFEAMSTRKTTQRAVVHVPGL